MGLTKIITAGIAGTTAMTLFSYYLSRKKARNFREPELLGELIIEIIPSAGKPGSLTCGWIIHYLVGIFFSGVYTCIPKEYLRGPVAVKYALTGSLTGMIGIAGWRTVLKFHPEPPKLDRHFYGQLVTAHAVFGTITLLILNSDRLFTHSKSKRSNIV